VSFRRALVTGGAGFVGSTLARRLRSTGLAAEVVALDNLRRRGSELQLARLAAGGVTFAHGDIRVAADIEACGSFDLLVDCSAEPSVHAGTGDDPSYLLDSNLGGTLHCLEAARRRDAAVLFLSTSRVYSIPALRALPLVEGETRLDLPPGAQGTGWSAAGIAADFPTTAPRSLYGTTKLASELLVQEYAAQYGLAAVVARCGVIAGPWQMGKVDQGFVALWCARHLWGGPLAYIGYGGSGRQVRDVLHVEDLGDLIDVLLKRIGEWKGAVFNAGGGPGPGSVSLAELTALCRARSDGIVHWSAQAQAPAVDIPWYVTDNMMVMHATDWRPRWGVASVVDDVFDWLRANEAQVRPILGG
jgi:CDP-paratose 2-epimerase